MRLYPNAKQRKALAAQFGCARWVWNHALAQTQRLYKEPGKGLSYCGMNVARVHERVANTSAGVVHRFFFD